MQVRFGKQEFNFFPRTFVLPQDIKLLRKAWEDGGSKQKWIIKPVCSVYRVPFCQVRRINILNVRANLNWISIMWGRGGGLVLIWTNSCIVLFYSTCALKALYTCIIHTLIQALSTSKCSLTHTITLWSMQLNVQYVGITGASLSVDTADRPEKVWS